MTAGVILLTNYAMKRAQPSREERICEHLFLRLSRWLPQRQQVGPRAVPL